MTWRQTISSQHEPTRPSRAVNIDADHAEIRTACDKKAFAISAIEPLPEGGTRVVMTNADGAAGVRRLFKAKLMTGEVARTSWAARA